MNVLIIGSRGNLGAVFAKKASTQFNLLRGSNEPMNESEFKIIPWVGIKTAPDTRVDLVINFANKYFPDPDEEQTEQMRNAIVGVARAIQNFNLNGNVPLISFATYFQFAPECLQPWSDYSQFKKEASAIYSSMGSDWTEVVLRDNFGGSRRNKFLDRALEANYFGEELDATEGYSLINLIHVDDICDYLISLTTQVISGEHPTSERVELRSEKTYTLRELVALVDKYRNKTTKVKWGNLPYRTREVFESWESAPLPLSWHPIHSLSDYIRDFKN
jgi:nucleoside-diphosphate-sugar epimerase